MLQSFRRTFIYNVIILVTGIHNIVHAVVSWMYYFFVLFVFNYFVLLACFISIILFTLHRKKRLVCGGSNGVSCTRRGLLHEASYSTSSTSTASSTLSTMTSRKKAVSLTLSKRCWNYGIVRSKTVVGGFDIIDTYYTQYFTYTIQISHWVTLSRYLTEIS